MADVQVCHGDALELDASDLAGFDVAIVDLPYSAHVHESAVTSGTLATGGPSDRDLGFECLSPELRAVAALAAANVKRWSIFFSDFEGAHLLRDAAEDAGAEYIRTIPWIRWSQPQLSGDRPPTGAEATLVFHAQHVGPRGGRRPLAKHWNGPGSLTHYAERAMRGRDKHPTEKPADLMLSIVSAFSDPGETVIDFCAGRGSTAVACRLLERGCLGIERDPKWARDAASRAVATLSDRDRVRALEWCETTFKEASSVPEPRAADGSDVKTWERAQRRLADVARVRRAAR